MVNCRYATRTALPSHLRCYFVYFHPNLSQWIWKQPQVQMLKWILKQRQIERLKWVISLQCSTKWFLRRIPGVERWLKELNRSESNSPFWNGRCYWIAQVVCEPQKLGCWFTSKVQMIQSLSWYWSYDLITHGGMI